MAREAFELVAGHIIIEHARRRFLLDTGSPISFSPDGSKLAAVWSDDAARLYARCDTVVFTGDWIPDHELARTGGLERGYLHSLCTAANSGNRFGKLSKLPEWFRPVLRKIGRRAFDRLGPLAFTLRLSVTSVPEIL